MTELKDLIDILYIGAAVLFILGLKMLGNQGTARKGNMLSALGMLLAIAATLLLKGMSYQWIIVALALGTIIGAWAASAVDRKSVV